MSFRKELIIWAVSDFRNAVLPILILYFRKDIKPVHHQIKSNQFSDFRNAVIPCHILSFRKVFNMHPEIFRIFEMP